MDMDYAEKPGRFKQSPCKRVALTAVKSIGTWELGPGGNYHVCRYGICHFLGCLFQEENKFWGIIFGKITSSHKFWGVIFRVLILIKFHLVG